MATRCRQVTTSCNSATAQARIILHRHPQTEIQDFNNPSRQKATTSKLRKHWGLSLKPWCECNQHMHETLYSTRGHLLANCYEFLFLVNVINFNKFIPFNHLFS